MAKVRRQPKPGATMDERRDGVRRELKRRATQPVRGMEDVTARMEDEFDPPANAGSNSGHAAYPEGTQFEWNEGLFFDPQTGSYYDRGKEEARDYGEMLRVYHKARALEQVLTGPLRGAGWKLVPGKGDTGEAEQMEEQLRRPPGAGGMSTPFQFVLGQMTNAFAMRRSFHAKGFKLDPRRNDGTLMYSQLAIRPASTCNLLRDPKSGAYAGFEQEMSWYAPLDQRGPDARKGLRIPFKPSQALVYVHGAHRDPVGGISDMEIVYWCWQTQKKLLFLWLNYLSGVALPRTIVKHKGDDAKAKAAAQEIAKLKSSGVAWIDMLAMELDTLDLSGKGPAGFADAIRYLDTSASGSVMATFTDLGAAAAGDASGGARGSFALSKDQTDFFLQGREMVAREMEVTIDWQVLSPIVKWNHGRHGVCPSFKFDPLAGIDEQPILHLLEAVATAPATALPAEFVNEIIVEASRILGLDVEKVTAAVHDAAEVARRAALAAGASAIGQKVAGVKGAVDKVTQIAKQATGK